MKYAAIKNNVVVNIIEASDEYVKTLSSFDDNNTFYVKCDDDVKINDGYQNGEFIIHKTTEEKIIDLENAITNINQKLSEIFEEIGLLQEVITEILLPNNEGGINHV